MKKLTVFLLSVLSVFTLNAKDYYLHTYKNGNVVLEKKINEIDSLSFLNNSVIFNYNNKQSAFQFSAVDSVTFSSSSQFGDLTITSVGNDAINAASTNNDAIGCNGNMYVTGGFTIASASKSPEEAFDCDNNTFGITGGTLIGTAPSRMYSYPTASACTQHSLLYTHSGNNAIQILNSSGDEIVSFKIPSISGGAGWDGSSSVAFIITMQVQPIRVEVQRRLRLDHRIQLRQLININTINYKILV